MRALTYLLALVAFGCGGPPDDPDAGGDAAPSPTADAGPDGGPPPTCPLDADERAVADALLSYGSLLIGVGGDVLDRSEGHEWRPQAGYLFAVASSRGASSGPAGAIACPGAGTSTPEQCSDAADGVEECHLHACTEAGVLRSTLGYVVSGESVLDDPRTPIALEITGGPGVPATWARARFETPPVFEWITDRSGSAGWTVELDHEHAVRITTDAERELDASHRAQLSVREGSGGGEFELVIEAPSVVEEGATRIELTGRYGAPLTVDDGRLTAPGVDIALGSTAGIPWPRECR